MSELQRWAEIAEQPGTEEVLWSRIADEGDDTQRDRLRIETRFKVAAAHARDRYGVQAASGPTQAVQVIVQREAKDG